MTDGDFRHTEQSVLIRADDTLRIELVTADGTVIVLREQVPVLAGEIVDAAVMHADAPAMSSWPRRSPTAKAEGMLFSVHLKATMMKVSDPIIFGHVVRAFFPKTFAKYGAELAAAGLNPNDGLGAILGALPAGQRDPGLVRRRAGRRARRWPWWTPTAASPTCTCRAT